MWNEMQTRNQAIREHAAEKAGCAMPKQPAPPTPGSPVAEGLAMLANEIAVLDGNEVEMLHQGLSALEQRLNPVLGDEPPSKDTVGGACGQASPSSATCELHHRVDSATLGVGVARLRLRAAISRVHVLMDRLRI